jgi:hypothetical protein
MCPSSYSCIQATMFADRPKLQHSQQICNRQPSFSCILATLPKDTTTQRYKLYTRTLLTAVQLLLRLLRTPTLLPVSECGTISGCYCCCD